MRRTESVASHQSLRLVLIELGKTARNMISRSSSSDVLGLLVPRLVLPSRVASRVFLVPDLSSWHSLVAMGVSCGPARFCLVVGEAECPSLVLCRGGVLALILCLSSRLLLVVSSRSSSRSPMSCEPWAGRHARFVVASRLLVSGSGEAFASRLIPAVRG